MIRATKRAKTKIKVALKIKKIKSLALPWKKMRTLSKRKLKV